MDAKVQAIVSEFMNETGNEPKFLYCGRKEFFELKNHCTHCTQSDEIRCYGLELIAVNKEEHLGVGS